MRHFPETLQVTRFFEAKKIAKRIPRRWRNSGYEAAGMKDLLVHQIELETPFFGASPMSTFVKSLFVAAALFAGAQSINTASAMSAGLTAACQSGSFSQHGIWDCR